MLKAGERREGMCQWTYPSGETVSLGIESDLRYAGWEFISLSYHLDRGESVGSAQMHYRVDLTSTVPRFGGLRWWFVCPQRGCRRRIGLLERDLLRLPALPRSDL